MPRRGGELDPLSEGEDNVLSRRFFSVWCREDWAEEHCTVHAKLNDLCMSETSNLAITRRVLNFIFSLVIVSFR